VGRCRNVRGERSSVASSTGSGERREEQVFRILRNRFFLVGMLLLIASLAVIKCVPPVAVEKDAKPPVAVEKDAKPPVLPLDVAHTGFGNAGVHYGTCHGDLTIVIWSVLPGVVRHTSIMSDAGVAFAPDGGLDRLTFEGRQRVDGESTVTWRLVTTDVKRGTVTVNGVDYELADGAVFLVRARDRDAKVIQVERDVSGMKPTNATWRRLAEDEPEISRFLKEVGGRK